MGNIVSFVVEAGLLGGCVIATYAYMTKPTDESFKRFMENYLKGNIYSKSDGPIQQLTKKIISKAGANILKPEIKDYIFFKTAEIHENGQDLYFTGAFQNWYPTQFKN